MVEIRQGIFVQQSVIDLERTLDTSRCIDIFTMSPKVKISDLLFLLLKKKRILIFGDGWK